MNPSTMPPGFEKEITAIADPSLALPGAPAVPTPVKGKITLANHPFSMPANGPLYNNAPVWNWKGIDIVIFDYLTTEGAAAEMLPEQCTTLPIPDLPGYSAVKHVWARYPDSSFGPYDEFFPGIPCLFKGQLFIYVPFIYVNNDSACAGGREIGGWPKKMADIRMDRVANEYRLVVDGRNRGTLAVAITTRDEHT